MTQDVNDGSIDEQVSIDYTQAYRLALDALRAQGRRVDVPVLYLQRHTFELVLKDVLTETLQLRVDLQLRHELFGSGKSVGFPSAEDEGAMNAGHDLCRLRRRIESSLEAIKLPHLPTEFADAVALFAGLESGDPSRLRYSRVRNRGTKRIVPSFEYSLENSVRSNLESVRCRATELLETIHSDHMRLQPSSEPRSFRERLDEERECCFFGLAGDLYALEQSTREGKVLWSREQEMSDLCAQIEGRTLAIVMLPGENVPVLMSAGADVERGHYVDLQAYGSNLARAAAVSSGR